MNGREGMLVGDRGRAARGARDDERSNEGREGQGEEGINEREGVDNNNNTQYQKSTPKRNIVQVHQKKRWKAVHRRLVKS